MLVKDIFQNSYGMFNILFNQHKLWNHPIEGQYGDHSRPIYVYEHHQVMSLCMQQQKLKYPKAWSRYDLCNNSYQDDKYLYI